MDGLILLAHGARDPAWVRPFEQVRERVGGRVPELRVELAFLEFIAPDLPEAGRRLVEAGCTRIVVVPAFLGQGGHVRKDVPALVDAMRGAHPRVEFRVSESVGEDGAVLDAIAGFCAAQAFANGDGV